MKRNILVVLLVFGMLAGGCIEDPKETLVIQTEEILYISAEKLRLLGRIVSDQAFDAVDHGFYISQHEDFSTSSVLSLGKKSSPGRFVGETKDLTNSKIYYAKSFLEIDGELLFGNVIELKSLTPNIDEFSPKFGKNGDNLVIFGQNFTEDSQVFFGNKLATITSIDFESRINVVIPSPASVTVPIKVISQDRVMEFKDLFEYQTGTFELITQFPEPIRLYGTVSYKIGNGFFIGLGTISKNSFYQKIQRLDLTTYSWSEFPFPGTPRAYAFSTENYLGGGTAGLIPNPYEMNYSFFQIDENGPEQIVDIPFESRESISFQSEGSLFVIGGLEGDTLAVRRYNASIPSWTIISETPQKFTKKNAHFYYNKKLFVVDSEKNLWEFEINSGEWRVVSQFPGSLGQGYGVGAVVGQKAYVGLYSWSSELWELDLNTFMWKAKNGLPSTNKQVTVAHFTSGDQLFIMRMPDITIAGNFTMDLYKFDTNGF